VFGRHANECRDDEARDVGVLRRVPQRQAVIAGIVFGQRRAWLDRIRYQAVVDQIDLGDVLGRAERVFHRFLVAEVPLVDRVVGDLAVDLRRVFILRARRIDHGRQRLVIDLHCVGGITRLRLGLRDHHRDCVADVIDLAVGERRMRRHLHRRAVL
jgi:hypothetical protein